MSDSASLQNTLASMRAREKLDLYQIGLIFTLLGLSVQTATFGRPIVADILELTGWIALLLAGLVGLWRAERIPEVYRMAGEQAALMEFVSDAEERRAHGDKTVHLTDTQTVVPIDAYIAKGRQSIKVMEEGIKPEKKRTVIAYRVMKAAFVTGILAMIGSRGYMAAHGILERL
jgi:hypothetical protein